MARQAREVPISGGSKFKRWRLEEGKPLCLRILPPLMTLADKGEYGVFETKLFVGGADPVDPTKTKTWPIASREESDWADRQRVVTVHDPLIDYIRPIMARRDAIQKKGEERGISKDEIQKAIATEKEFLRRHSISAKWSFYAMDRNGEFGVLELNNPTKKDLYDRAKKYSNEDGNENPFGIKAGIFWVFTRTGNLFAGGKDTIDIFRLSEKIGDKKVETIPTHEFTEELEVVALKTLPNFTAEQERISYPVEVHEQIVAAKGDPLKIRDIMSAAHKVKEAQNKAKLLAAAQTKAATDADESEEIDPDAVLGGEDPFAGVKTAGTSATPPVAESSAEDDEEAELIALQAKLAAKKAAKAAAAAPAAEAEKPKAAKKADVNPADMTDEDFNAMFPKGAKKAP